MDVPDTLSDRLVVVSGDDYVRLLDDHPGTLKTGQVTIVPVPLTSAWRRFPELRASNLTPGRTYMRDIDDPGRYVPVDQGVLQTAEAKIALLFTVCQKLGATSVETTTSSSESSSATLADHFTSEASAGRSLTKKGKQVAHAEGTSKLAVDLTGEVRDRVRMTCQARGRWAGGAPSFDAARAAIRGHDPADVKDLRSLIEQREDDHNPLTEFHVDVDFSSEARRSLGFIVQATHQVEAALRGHGVRAGTDVRNSLEFESVRLREVTWNLRVTFDKPPHE